MKLANIGCWNRFICIMHMNQYNTYICSHNTITRLRYAFSYTEELNLGQYCYAMCVFSLILASSNSDVWRLHSTCCSQNFAWFIIYSFHDKTICRWLKQWWSTITHGCLVEIIKNKMFNGFFCVVYVCYYGNRFSRLVASSTGKEGVCVLVIFHEPMFIKLTGSLFFYWSF